MIENLQTTNSSVIEKTQLLNLGRVNVVCGKNNSGKSTFLQILNNKEENIFFGRTINLDDVNSLTSLWRQVANTLNFIVGQDSINFWQITAHIDIQKIFSKLIDFKSAWFVNENTLLQNKFWDLFCEEAKIVLHSNSPFTNSRPSAQLELQGYTNNYVQEKLKDHIGFIFNEIFHSDLLFIESCNPFLVLPKRNVSVQADINKIGNVQADGKNITQQLFESKNKLGGTSQFNFYHKLQDAFAKVSGNYRFNISMEDDEAGLLRLSFSPIDQEAWGRASEWGLGLRDLLVILYFALESEYDLILLEEPESHLHPEMQRKLLRFLAEETTNKQFFIATHSNIFVNSTYVDRVFFTKFENGGIIVNDETKLSEMLHDLGYSVTDNLVSDLIILVEGKTDTPVIEEFLRKLKIDEKYNIKTWALGGDIMAAHDLSVFAERYKVMALIDKDPKSQIVRKKFIENCKALNIPVTRLKRYSIENYFSLRALKEVFKGQISNEIRTIEPDKKLSDQISIDVKNNNRKLAKETTLEEIQGTDLKLFFDNVLINLEKL